MCYFHTQPNGLPEELSDTSGHLVWTAQYSTWGSTVREEWQSYDEAGRPVQRLQQQSASQTVQLQQNLRMQGQYLDRETGLHYNTFRYYDADLGAFTTPDPIGLGGGINLHQYAPNPIAWIDPWGLSPVCRMTGVGHSKASDLPVVRPGTKQWDAAVQSLKMAARGIFESRMQQMRKHCLRRHEATWIEEKCILMMEITARATKFINLSQELIVAEIDCLRNSVGIRVRLTVV